MLTERAITICLLEILREYSDYNHILPMGEIIRKAKNIYGLSPDRRTIYSALDTLVELGYDISFYKENGKGYYLRDKQLEPSEAHLLSDAVCNFPFISEKQTAQLMKKIHSLVNAYERKQIKNLTVIRNDKKTANKNIFYNIEVLDEAIERGRKVTFDYYDYGTDKQLHKRREKKYKVNPYGMVYTNEHYYLVCIMSRQTNVSMYRIDRIQNIEITDIELDKHDIDQYSIVSNAVYAHTGEAVDVEMLIEPKVLNDVIDRFGTNLTLSKADDGRIKAHIKVATMGMKYWALQYLASVEIVEPKELRNEIIELLGDNWYCETR